MLQQAAHTGIDWQLNTPQNHSQAILIMKAGFISQTDRVEQPRHSHEGLMISLRAHRPRTEFSVCYMRKRHSGDNLDVPPDLIAYQGKNIVELCVCCTV